MRSVTLALAIAGVAGTVFRCSEVGSFNGRLSVARHDGPGRSEPQQTEPRADDGAAPEEEDRADVPSEVTGSFLTCDEVSITDAAPGRAYYGCSAFSGDGHLLAFPTATWVVRFRDGGLEAEAAVMPSESPQWSIYVSFDESLVGTVDILLVTPGLPVELVFPTTASPATPAPLDQGLGSVDAFGGLCRGNFKLLDRVEGEGRCPAQSVVVAVNDGKDITFACCELPVPILKDDGNDWDGGYDKDDDSGKGYAESGGSSGSSSGSGSSSKSDKPARTCLANEVQTGVGKDFAPRCTGIDTTRYAFGPTTSAVYVSAKRLPPGLDLLIAADLLTFLADGKNDDACLCPDLRMVMLGGHGTSNNKCEDRCALILEK